jgi:asparagine synthetase B (glutamine-hydrolysing)
MTTADATIPASRYTPLEIASGWLSGVQHEPLPPASRVPARQHLDASLRTALESGRPVVVGFSGGRDSSALLAAAVAVARREGLPEPVPATYLYDDPAHDEEHRFQELVVRHVGCSEWLRIEVGDRHDLLGDEAVEWLRCYGVTVPVFGYSRGLLFKHVPGAHVVTGEGGDFVLGTKRSWLLRNVLARRGRVPARVLAEAAATVLPGGLRRRRLHAELVDERPWLRPEAARAYAEAAVRDQVAEPLDWRRATWRVNGMRILREGLALLDDFAERSGCTLAHPLLERPFVAALAHGGGRLGYRSRTEAMRALFGDVLPDAVLTRRTKATFNASVVGERTRDFVRSWRGEGVDPALVDADTVRELWMSEHVPAGSLALLQHTWVASERAAQT